MNSSEINMLSKHLEQDSLADSLARLSSKYKNDVSWPDMPPRSKEQDTDYNTELQTAMRTSLEKEVTNMASALRKVHEACRDQRDFEIIRAGRKKLMKGCAIATKWRYEKLGRQIEALEKSPK